MKIYHIFTLLFMQSVHSFILKPQIYKRNFILQSHFTKITTQLKDKDILIQSLLEVNPYLMIYDGPDTVVDYNKNEIIADIIVRQDNGSEIGFCLKNGSYEMVSDLQFWQQTVPPDVFLERVTQKYSINSILDSLEEEGFYTDCIVYNNETSCIELTASKYKV